MTDRESLRADYVLVRETLAVHCRDDTRALEALYRQGLADSEPDPILDMSAAQFIAWLEAKGL